MKKIVIATLAAFLLGAAVTAQPAEARCEWNGYAWHCWHPYAWWWHHHHHWGPYEWRY